MMKTLQRHHLFDAVIWTAALGFLVVLAVHEAHAESRRFDPGPAAYRNECGSCHVAYPPALLSPSAWATVLGRLDRHYGVDASVDAGTLASIRTALGAGGAGATAPDLPRISTQPWFLHEHRKAAQRDNASGRSGAAAAAQAGALAPGAPVPSSRSATLSNCAACHTRATAGDYSESSLRITR
jgi:mono/diheme cytochrome c family protein